MTMSYQQQYVLDATAGRAAILNLNARHNRLYSSGDVAGWIATFRHAGATYTRGGQTFSDLSEAFDGGGNSRMVTVDHDITVDGVDAAQECVVMLFCDNALAATGTFSDRLIYERGGWYFTSRDLQWDRAPRKNALSV